MFCTFAPVIRWVVLVAMGKTTNPKGDAARRHPLFVYVPPGRGGTTGRGKGARPIRGRTLNTNKLMTVGGARGGVPKTVLIGAGTGLAQLTLTGRAVPGPDGVFVAQLNTPAGSGSAHPDRSPKPSDRPNVHRWHPDTGTAHRQQQRLYGELTPER